MSEQDVEERTRAMRGNRGGRSSRISIRERFRMPPLGLILRLARLKMTVFSAVTYATAISMYLQDLEAPPLKVRKFIAGYFFMLSCQLLAHFSGEYYDLPSDKLNQHSTPMTGGSKVLLTDPDSITPAQCLAYARVCLLASLALLVNCLPRHCWAIGLAMVVLAHQYSAPPLRMNHRGLGEVGAALVMNILLPLFAVMTQQQDLSETLASAKALLILVLPSAMLKFSLFLALNMEDRRADWLGGKRTLPVKWGEEVCCQLLAVFNAGAYASVIVLYGLGYCSLPALAAVLVSAPWGLRIAASFCPQGGAKRPYRLSGLVLQSLKHAPCVLLGLYSEAVAWELWHWLHDEPPDMAAVLSLLLRSLPLVPFVSGVLLKRKPPPGPLEPSTSPSAAAGKVVVVGGGVGGMILGLALQELGMEHVVLERGDEAVKLGDAGADLALWPSATKILKELGVGDEHFWEEAPYPVETVYLTDVDRHGQEDVLQKISMSAVVEGCGESFCLIGREALTRAISRQCKHIACGKKVIEVEEGEGTGPAQVLLQGGQVEVGRIVVGADGINSTCRKAVTGGGEGRPRYGGEVCFRGVIDMSACKTTPEVSKLFKERETQRPMSMTVSYGDNIRFSWGYLNRQLQQGYWFVKQITGSCSNTYNTLTQEVAAQWPEPLKTIASAHSQGHGSGSYVHAIQDRPPLQRWSSPHITLIGDACHAATPNDGQGACMAIEDAFVLATLLKEYWAEPDGHVEAFYQYEAARKQYCLGIQADSYKKMKLGQLQGPVMGGLRRMLLRLVPTGMLQKKLRACNMFLECDAYIERFRKLRKMN